MYTFGQHMNQPTKIQRLHQEMWESSLEWSHYSLIFQRDGVFQPLCVRCHLDVAPVLLPVDLTAIPFFIWRHFSSNTLASLVSASLPSTCPERIFLIFFLLPSCVAQAGLLSFDVLFCCCWKIVCMILENWERTHFCHESTKYVHSPLSHEWVIWGILCNWWISDFTSTTPSSPVDFIVLQLLGKIPDEPGEVTKGNVKVQVPREESGTQECGAQSGWCLWHSVSCALHLLWHSKIQLRDPSDAHSNHPWQQARLLGCRRAHVCKVLCDHRLLGIWKWALQPSDKSHHTA